MTWLPLIALLLLALRFAYVAGRDRGNAEGIVAGLLIAHEDADPISEFVEGQRVASGEGWQ